MKTTDTQLEVYQRAFEASMEVFKLTDGFPPSERFSLTTRIRGSALSVSVNAIEALAHRTDRNKLWRKLTDAESAADETMMLLQMAKGRGYLSDDCVMALIMEYELILSTLISMRIRVDELTFVALVDPSWEHHSAA